MAPSAAPVCHCPSLLSVRAPVGLRLVRLGVPLGRGTPHTAREPEQISELGNLYVGFRFVHRAPTVALHMTCRLRGFAEAQRRENGWK